MSGSHSTPCGLKVMLECVTRTILLRQPKNIPEFLSTHLGEMIRDHESRDTEEVTCQYQEQLESVISQEKHKETESSEPCVEQSPSPSSVSSTSSSSGTASPSCEETTGIRKVSPVRVSPSCQEAESPTAEGQPTPVASPPRGENLEASQEPSFVNPGPKDTQPSQPSACPELPAVKPKAPPPRAAHREQGRRPVKGRGRGFTCRLGDCPYHDKGPEADGSPGSATPATGPVVQKSLAGPGPFELRVPYRPKGGPIADPELAPKRARAGCGRNRTTGDAGSTLLDGRPGTHGRREALPEGSSGPYLSLKSSARTRPDLVHAVLVVGFARVHVRCGQRHRAP